MKEDEAAASPRPRTASQISQDSLPRRSPRQMKSKQPTPIAADRGVTVEERHEERLTMSARRRQASYMAETVADLSKEVENRKLQVSKDGSNMPVQAFKEKLVWALMQDDLSKKKWVRSRGFEIFFGVVVIINAIFIGVQIDKPSTFSVSTWFWISVFFFMVFSLEIVVKVVVLGFREYVSDHWNVFDVVVSILVFLEVGTYYGLFAPSYYDHLSKYIAADIVQILRLCRLLRLSRVFAELGCLLTSLITSLQAIFWIVFLSFMWFYLMACIATVFIGRRDQLPSEDQEEIRELRDRFSNIGYSLFALFELMTLEGWTDYCRPLLGSRLHLVFLFLTFICTSAFFILNLVTGVVVDKTIAAQEDLEESDDKDERIMVQAHINCIYRVLLQKNKAAKAPPTSPGAEVEDANDPDIMSWGPFKEALNDPEILQALEDLGWEKRYLEAMFAMIDYDADGDASLIAMKQLLEASHQPLDTSNYVRFQINLSRRLEFQEQLSLTMIHGIEQLIGESFEMEDDIRKRIEKKTMLEGKDY